jgi:antitoxin VapB
VSLNIKSKETHKLAQRLAKLTGENMTEAVTVAVRERLERVQNERRPNLEERILAIGKDFAARLKETGKTLDEDFLYDENGLPKRSSTVPRSLRSLPMNRSASSSPES